MSRRRLPSGPDLECRQGRTPVAAYAVLPWMPLARLYGRGKNRTWKQV